MPIILTIKLINQCKKKYIIVAILFLTNRTSGKIWLLIKDGDIAKILCKECEEQI